MAFADKMQRCLIITSCRDCPNRMEMYHLYKPYGMMVLPDSKESIGFHGRWICTETNDDKEILSDLPEWCPLPLFQQHDPAPAPIGTCPHGSPVHIGEDEDYIECHSLNECNYRASSDGPHPLCTREAAALALAEEPVTLEGYTGADILKGPIYIDRDTETIFPIVCRDGTTRLVKLTGTCTMELLQQKVKPRHCEFASWLDGYFLCKSQNECEFQEGAGLTFYCGRHDANLIRAELNGQEQQKEAEAGK